MADIIKNLTHIHLIDEHRIYLSEITERFQNPLKYSVESYSDISTLFENLETSSTGKKNLHLVFVSVDFERSEEEIKKALDSITRIKNLRKNCEIFVLSSQKDDSLENRVNNYGARALIQKNENAVLRITNFIKGIISEKNLEKTHKATIFSVMILFYFILAVAAITLILFLIFPDRFYF
jgi:DNA-binding NarL/FixJ family response regulator